MTSCVAPLRGLVPDLMTEHVRFKEVVQLGLMPADNDVSAVGAFVASGGLRRELLFLAERPSDRAMAVHGDKWNELQPAEHLLAGRATAIVVNAANQLDSLTLGQVQAIFRGEVDDWAILGPTGLAPGTPGSSPGLIGISINRFGLARTDPAAQAFYRDGVPANELRRVTYVTDTAAALAAVSMDRQAIAFVDLAAIPEGGQTVKILAIQLGPRNADGRAQIIRPTAQSIRDAMYPFAERVYLYVHPQASETAKSFAEFLATSGQSAATPYTDPVKDVMTAYRKHGLIPLAEPAIQRMLKDAHPAGASGGGEPARPVVPVR